MRTKIRTRIVGKVLEIYEVGGEVIDSIHFNEIVKDAIPDLVLRGIKQKLLDATITLPDEQKLERMQDILADLFTLGDDK